MRMDLTGGVGSTAVQFAKRLGVGLVIGTVGSEQKVGLVRELGADQVINYRYEHFSARVLEFTKGAGVDLILDSVAGAHPALSPLQDPSDEKRIDITPRTCP